MDGTGLQRLLDEADVARLVLAFGRALDEKDWDAYGETFTDDGEFTILGQTRHGRADIVAGPARDLERYGRLQHISTNVTTRVDGDVADVRWYLLGVHVPDAGRPAEHADIGGCYTGVCRRTDAGWRFTSLALEIWWTGGHAFGVEPHPADTTA